jgi:hypothetical protein
LACWLLLAAAAHVLAEPAAAAVTGKDSTKLQAAKRSLAQPVLDYEAERPAAPRAESAVLPPEHPISKVVSCLGRLEGPIYPANSTAYEAQEKVARCGTLQHDALRMLPSKTAAAYVELPYAMHVYMYSKAAPSQHYHEADSK